MVGAASAAAATVTQWQTNCRSFRKRHGTQTWDHFKRYVKTKCDRETHTDNIMWIFICVSIIIYPTTNSYGMWPCKCYLQATKKERKITHTHTKHSFLLTHSLTRTHYMCFLRVLCKNARARAIVFRLNIFICRCLYSVILTPSLFLVRLLARSHTTSQFNSMFTFYLMPIFALTRWYENGLICVFANRFLWMCVSVSFTHRMPLPLPPFSPPPVISSSLICMLWITVRLYSINEIGSILLKSFFFGK